MPKYRVEATIECSPVLARLIAKKVRSEVRKASKKGLSVELLEIKTEKLK